MTTFHIQSQAAGSIQNVGNDMTVNGGLHSTAAFDAAGLQAELMQLAEDLNQADMAPEHRFGALSNLAHASVETARPEPDRESIGARIAKTAEVLRDAGALASGGSALVQTLCRIAELLGPAGHALTGVLALV
jgi:hypothetical protein